MMTETSGRGSALGAEPAASAAGFSIAMAFSPEDYGFGASAVAGGSAFGFGFGFLLALFPAFLSGLASAGGSSASFVSRNAARPSVRTAPQKPIELSLT